MTTKSTEKVRLQKYIADAGITSRRKAEELILDGRVKVNGTVINVLGSKVDPSVDVVQVDQKFIHPEAVEKLYIVLNKPRGVITSVSDPEGRETVLDLLKSIPQRVFPVGRLDYLSEGLLLLTNDGDFAHLIMHPRHEIVKVYEVKVFGVVTDKILKELAKGTRQKDGLLKPLSVRVIGQLKNKTWLEFKLAEGKNREVRRLCEAVGLTVDKLRRVSIAGLSVNHLPVGQFDIYSKKEILKLLGLNEEGQIVEKKLPHQVLKKSIKKENLVIKAPTAKAADSKEFKRFRKNSYYQTLNSGNEKDSKDSKNTKNTQDSAKIVNKIKKINQVKPDIGFKPTKSKTPKFRPKKSTKSFKGSKSSR